MSINERTPETWNHLQMFLTLNAMFLNMRIFAMLLQWRGFLLSISRMQ